MIDYKLEWILVLANKKKSKFVLKATRDDSLRIPFEFLHAMGWEQGQEVIISNAWWGKAKDSKCYRIQIELAEKPKKAGRWAK